jgi:hypothetical protein
MATNRTRTVKPTPPANGLEPELDIAEDDDLPVIDGAEEEVGAEAEQANVVGESVDELKEQLRLANERAANLEEAQRKATAETGDARLTLFDTQQQLLDSAIGREEAAKKDLKAQKIAAKEAGDYSKEADLDDQLQVINVKIARMTEGKNEMQRRREQIEDTPADPVEAYVAGMAPRAQKWVREHAEVVTDPVKRSDLETAHFAAKGKRLAEGSDAYFDFIEQELGYADKQQLTDTVDLNPPRREQRYTAPVSRGNTAESGAGLPNGVTKLPNGQYRLTPALQEGARIAGQSDAEYLKNLLALQKEGRLTTH